MSSNKIEKLKILEGNDMFPSIRSNEFLLLDKEAVPKIGDVILIENRYGMKIAHRLIHRFGGYYFTRGDNCPVFNFPSRKDKVLGVIVSKYKKVEKNPLLGLFLGLFLAYFIFYNLFFDIKKKKEFLMLKIISKYLA